MLSYDPDAVTAFSRRRLACGQHMQWQRWLGGPSSFTFALMPQDIFKMWL